MKNQAMVEALRRQVELERSSKKHGRVRYSQELKQGVVALLENGQWGPTRVSRALGLAESVVHRWSKPGRTGRGRDVVGSRARSPEMTRVDVVTTTGTEAKTFELEFPSGARIVGLTRDDLVDLLGGAR